jgi:hypothetical protein
MGLAGEATRETQVRVEMSAISKATDYLATQVDELLKRTETVRQPKPVCPSGENKKETVLCPLASDIRTVRDKLDLAGKRIKEIIVELEI